MLFRISWMLMLGILVVIACDDKEEDDKLASRKDEQKTMSGYVLNVKGDDGLSSSGVGRVEIQLQKNGTAVTDADGKKVALKIVCGKHNKEFSGSLDKQGKASVDIDLSKEGWTVSDWSKCKLSATLKIGNENIEIVDVDLKTVSGEGATSGACEKEGGCDDAGDTLAQFKIGEEIGQASLGGGSLSLHGCSNVSLYTVSGNEIARKDTGAMIAADTATQQFPVMFVLGTPGSNCKLQHHKDDKTTDWAKIVVAEKGDNLAAGSTVEFAWSPSPNTSLWLTLRKPQPTGLVSVYASVDSGASWTIQSNAKWDDKDASNNVGFSTNLNYQQLGVYAARALLRVVPAASDDDASGTTSNSNNTAWWHMYADEQHGMSIGEVKIGMIFTVKAVDIDINTSQEVRVEVSSDCGLHFFHLINNSKMKRIPPAKAKNAIDVSIPASATSFKALAVDGGTASYRGNGCKVGLEIEGATVMAKSTAIDTARPAITGIAMNNRKTQGQMLHVGVDLPAWNNSHGEVKDASIKASNDAGDNWKTATVTWGTSATSHYFDDLGWSSTVSNNQALVSASITPTGAQSATTWWYYAEGK